MAASGDLVAWKRVGQQIKTARIRLGYRTINQFAARTGLGSSTISQIERGIRTRYRVETLGTIEQTLMWQIGTIEQAIAGSAIQLRPDPDLERIIAVWPNLSPTPRRALAEFVERLAGG